MAGHACQMEPLIVELRLMAAPCEPLCAGVGSMSCFTTEPGSMHTCCKGGLRLTCLAGQSVPKIWAVKCLRIDSINPALHLRSALQLIRTRDGSIVRHAMLFLVLNSAACNDQTSPSPCWSLAARCADPDV